MGSDQPVGGPATDGEHPAQEPEGGHLDGVPDAHNRPRGRCRRHGPAVTGKPDLFFSGPLLVGFQADIRGFVAHEQPDHRHRHGRAGNQHVRTHAPADVSDDQEHERGEDDLSRRTAAAENAHRESPPGVEPAMRHRSGEYAGHAAGPQPHHDPPGQPELPQLGHESGAQQTHREQGQRGHHDPARPVFVQNPTHHRSGDAVEQKVDGDPERDGGASPSKLRFERKDQHGGNHPDAGPVETGEKGHGHDEPRVMKGYRDGWARRGIRAGGLIHPISLSVGAGEQGCL